MEEKDIKRLKEVTQELINKLAHFNGLSLLIYGSNELTIDERIDSLIIDLNELKIALSNYRNQ